MMLIVDAHEDIAWNMLTFGRDYNLSAAEIRLREKGSLAVQQNEDTLLGWPEYQRGRVGLIFATLFAAPIRRYEGKWDTLIYRDFDEAHRHYRSQVDVYRRLSDDNPSRFRLVMNLNDMTGVLEG